MTDCALFLCVCVCVLFHSSRTVKRTCGIFWGQKDVCDADKLLFSNQLVHDSDTAQLAL